MPSAWLRTPRLNEPEDFHEREARAEQHDTGRAQLDRFGEFTPPRPTIKETCIACAGAGKVGEFPCPVCAGKGYRNVFFDRATPPASRTNGAPWARRHATLANRRRREILNPEP